MRTVTLGEIMLRLSPPAHGRFVQAKSLDVCYGGGEANVAVGLAQFGLEAAFVTALPAHEMGQAAVNALRGFGVDTRSILRQDPSLSRPEHRGLRAQIRQLFAQAGENGFN